MLIRHLSRVPAFRQLCIRPRSIPTVALTFTGSGSLRTITAMPKRKAAAAVAEVAADAPLTNGDAPQVNGTKRRRSQKFPAMDEAELDPDTSKDVLDGPLAQRGSPDQRATPPPEKGPRQKRTTKATKDSVKVESTPAPSAPSTPASAKSAKSNADEGARGDPEADDDEPADPEEVKAALHRPPPVHSSILPLPWKGRLGYACLNTYLRNSNPAIFCSRTTRIASILEHRHPLADPTQPEHPTKNRPDKEKPADIALGQKFVENLCLANVADISKMIRWNDRYGIRFLRLSSEMFPFASHAEYGYTLDFAGPALAEAGKVIAELGHRVTTHPGQFTQLGSPRAQVIEASIRDLAYHDQLLSLLDLPDQANRDAVMILHMGGAFGSKPETLDRFRTNYAKLPQSVKNRLVLENDDVVWSVHDLLPICEELNIPFVLDFHHHNIIFDETQIREGTHDIIALFPRILATWQRKGITPKMHYSEPTAPAITPKQRRKHSARVMTLPPCPANMDLMIEAKDKEQAVFELMRTFKLPGWNTFNDVIPYVRTDDNKILEQAEKKANTKKAKAAAAAAAEAGETQERSGPERISEEDRGMGGPDGRVYWPPGMEEWLRPQKRVIKPKSETPKKGAKKDAAETAKAEAENLASEVQIDAAAVDEAEVTSAITPGKKSKPTPKPTPKPSRSAKKIKEPSPSLTPSENEDETNFNSEALDAELDELSDELEDEARAPIRQTKAARKGRPTPARSTSGRAARGGKKNYAVGDEDEDDE